MTNAQNIDYVVHGSTFNLAAFRPISDEISRLAVNDDPWRQCVEEFRRGDDSIRF